MEKERIPVSAKPVCIGYVGGAILHNTGAVPLLVDDHSDMVGTGLTIAAGDRLTIPGSNGTRLYAWATAGDGAEVTVVRL